MFVLLGLIQLNTETHGAAGLRNPKKSLTEITSDLCPKSRPHPHHKHGMFPKASIIRCFSLSPFVCWFGETDEGKSQKAGSHQTSPSLTLQAVEHSPKCKVSLSYLLSQPFSRTKH